MESQCPVCKGSTNKFIGKARTNSISRNFIDKDYRIVSCGDCGLYFVDPLITFSPDQWAELYNSEYFAAQSEWLIKRRAEELNNRFNKAAGFLKKDGKIAFLDVGTGEGKTLIEGAARGWGVTGVDIVDNRIDEAKESSAKFIKGNFLELDFPPEQFDIIYLDSVLEHVLFPLEYLMKIRQILKPGGILYVGVPNEDSLFNDVKGIVFKLIGRHDISVRIKPFISPYHVIGFNNRSIKNTADRADLKIVSLENTGRKFDFLSHKPTQRGFWITLFLLLPIEFIGKLLKKDVYYEAYLTK